MAKINAQRHVSGTLQAEELGSQNNKAVDPNSAVTVTTSSISYGVPWYPTSIPSCSLWLDADDASSMTVSGTNISEWRNKSTEFPNLFDYKQDNASYQPLFVAGAVNDRAVVRFDGSDDFLFGSGSTDLRSPAASDDVLTFFIAIRSYPSLQSSYRVPFIMGLDANYDHNGNNLHTTRLIDWNGVVSGYGMTFQARSTLYGMLRTSIGLTLSASVHAATVTGSSPQYHINGENALVQTLNLPLASLYPSSDDYIYSRIGKAADDDTWANPFGGDIAEIICYAKELSAAERSTVETYLQNKWSITVATQSSDLTSDNNLTAYPTQSFFSEVQDNCSLWADFTDTTKVKTTGSDPGNEVYRVEDKSRNSSDPVQETSLQYPHHLSTEGFGLNNLPSLSGKTGHLDLTGAVGVPWYPTTIPSCSLWLDAADASSMTVSGTNISEWRNKSTEFAGLFDYGQSAASSQPLLVASEVNGKPVVRFDGSDDYLKGSGSITQITPAATNDEMTVFYVLKYYPSVPSDSATDSVLAWGLNSSFSYSSTKTSWIIYDHNGASGGNRIFFGDNQNQFRHNSIGWTTDPLIYSLTNTASADLYITGTAVAGTTNTLPNTDAYTTDTSLIYSSVGYPGFAGSNFQGDIAEIIVYAKNLSTTERTTVETYLQNKWNITVATQSSDIDSNNNTVITSGRVPWTANSASTVYGVFRKYENSGEDYLLSYGEKKIRTSGSNLQWEGRASSLQASSSLSIYKDYIVTVSEEGQSFLPLSIPSCSLWLDADDASTVVLNGADVSQWQDKSGKGNHFGQTTSNLQPTYITSSSPFSPRSTIKTDPDNQTYLYTNSSTDLATTVGSDEHMTIFSVAKYNSTGPNYATQFQMGRSSLGSGGSNSISFLCDRPGYYTNMTIAGTPVNTLESDVFPTSNIWTIRTNADGVIIRNSGSVGASQSNTLGSSFAGTGIHVLGDSYSGQRPSYDYAEFIVYNRSLTDAEITTVETYLQNKWGITVATQSAVPYGTSSIYLNGVLEQHSTSSISNNSTVGAIAGSGSSDGNFAGNIGEIVMYDPAVTSYRNRKKVERYLADKYNINYTGFQPNQITASIDATGNSKSKLVLWLDANDTSTITEEEWSPLELPSCSLWLDADDASSITLNGSTVSQWNNKADHLTTGLFNYVQSNSSYQPTYVTGALNSKALVRFDGSDDGMFGSGSTSVRSFVSSGETDVTVFYVFSGSGGTQNNTTLLNWGLESDGTGLNNQTTFAFFYLDNRFQFEDWPGSGGIQSSTDVLAAGKQMISVVQEGAGSKLFVEGAEDASAATKTDNPDVYPSNQDYHYSRLGFGRGSTGRYFSGGIAEIVIYDRALSDNERATVETYFQNKWNITVATQSAAYYEGNAITNWSSKVGSISATQTSAAYRPTTGSINGKNIVLFSGSTYPAYLELTGTATASLDFVAGTDSYTIFSAFQRKSGSNYGTILSKGSQYALSYNQTDNLIKSDFGSNAVSGTDPKGSTFHLASSLTSPTLNKIYVTGTLAATGAIGSAITGSSAVHIGSQEVSSSVTNQIMSGAIGELLVYTGSLTDFERKHVEEYLYDKWEIVTSASY